MLVYENYSKFISATDVIRAMEEKVISISIFIIGTISHSNIGRSIR